MPSNLTVLEECIFRELFQTLAALRGAPPSTALEFRRRALDLCTRRGPNATTRRVLMHTLPNGDWDLDNVVQCYTIAPCNGFDAERLAKAIATALAAVFAGTRLMSYPRHRWMGCDAVSDDAC